MAACASIKNPACMVITLVYNSQRHIQRWYESLSAQTLPPAQIVLVDTGSKDQTYLKRFTSLPNMELILAPPESGFCKGNNIAWQRIQDDIDYVLFLNPDAFLSETFLQQASALMQQPSYSNAAALTGPLLGYDIDKQAPTRLYDSTGIFQSWWGKWYDRDQGKPVHHGQYTQIEAIPAICGACCFARRSALTAALIRGQEVFDNAFYMYKEDIDLSLRLRQKGWNLFFDPSLVAYHCRGWSPDRKKMAKHMRLHSARNEARLHLRACTPLPLCYSIFKYLAVKYLNV